MEIIVSFAQQYAYPLTLLAVIAFLSDLFGGFSKGFFAEIGRNAGALVVISFVGLMVTVGLTITLTKLGINSGWWDIVVVIITLTVIIIFGFMFYLVSVKDGIILILRNDLSSVLRGVTPGISIKSYFEVKDTTKGAEVDFTTPRSLTMTLKADNGRGAIIEVKIVGQFLADPKNILPYYLLDQNDDSARRSKVEERTKGWLGELLIEFFRNLADEVIFEDLNKLREGLVAKFQGTGENGDPVTTKYEKSMGIQYVFVLVEDISFVGGTEENRKIRNKIVNMGYGARDLVKLSQENGGKLTFAQALQLGVLVQSDNLVAVLSKGGPGAQLFGAMFGVNDEASQAQGSQQ